MKNLVLIGLSALISYDSAFGQRASLSTLLEQRVSLKIESSSLAGAVHQLIDAAEVASKGSSSGIKFIFKNSQKFQSIEKIEIVIKNEKMRRAFDHIGAAYRHEIGYDYSKGIVRLVAARGGEDSVRRYVFSEEVAKQLNLTFASVKKVGEEISALGVIANLESVDLANHSIILRGRRAELDYLDMVVVVYGRQKKVGDE
jgi:hypothetical protein